MIDSLTDLDADTQQHLTKMLKLYASINRWGRMTSANTAGDELYIYRIKDQLAWGVNNGKTGLNIARGVVDIAALLP